MIVVQAQCIACVNTADPYLSVECQLHTHILQQYQGKKPKGKKENERQNRERKNLVDEGQWALGSPFRDVAAKKEQVTTGLHYTATFVACFLGNGAGPNRSKQ